MWRLVCMAENNEGIMWNGFLPRWEPGEQWSHKRGFVLPEFQSRHFACPQCDWVCHPVVGNALCISDDRLEAGMRPLLAFSTGDAFPVLNPHCHWTHGFGVTSLTLIDFSSHILLPITYMSPWFWPMMPLKYYQQHLLSQTSLFFNASWNVFSVGDAAAGIHRLFFLLSLSKMCCFILLGYFRMFVRLVIKCVCDLLPFSDQSKYSNTESDRFSRKKDQQTSLQA